MPLLGVIPARLGSSRLPEKPLRLLAGDPLILWVVRRVADLGRCDRLVVATDAPAVVDTVSRAGYEAILTSERHRSGTERIAEVVGRGDMAPYDVILNVQGDEPFVAGEALAGAVAEVHAGNPIGTAAGPLDARDATDPNRVKVVVDAEGRALYFSRAPVPFARDGRPAPGTYWQHIGVYAYTRDALRRWVAWPPTAAEQAEQLEQLRPLHYGLAIGVARLAQPAPGGIDTAEDLAWAEQQLRAQLVTRNSERGGGGR